MMENDIIKNNEFLLNWYVESGIDETIAETPCCFFEENNKIDKINITPVIEKKVVEKPKIIITDSSNLSIQNANKLVEEIKTVDELEQAVKKFEGCSLKVTAKNTVFGDGNPDSKILIIGESPGADEDRTGRPFVGKSGILLDKMLKSIGLDRSNVYISNTIYWRPPGNRTPTTSEINICLPFVKKLIEIMSPDIIITLGGSAASTVLNTNETISKLRGRWLEYNINDKNISNVMASFHPSYLLRNPITKKKSWADLLKIKKKIADISQS